MKHLHLVFQVCQHQNGLVSIALENKVIKKVDTISKLENENIKLDYEIRAVEDYLNNLSEYSKNILTQHYILEYSFKKIADNFDKKESVIKKEIKELIS